MKLFLASSADKTLGLLKEQESSVGKKVVFVSNAADPYDEDGFERLVKRFIALNKEIIELGVIEKNFNLGSNFGLTKNNELVLVDIGDLVFGKDKINEQISKRPWTRDLVLKFIPPKFHTRFVETMDKELS